MLKKFSTRSVNYNGYHEEGLYFSTFHIGKLRRPRQIDLWSADKKITIVVNHISDMDEKVGVAYYIRDKLLDFVCDSHIIRVISGDFFDTIYIRDKFDNEYMLPLKFCISDECTSCNPPQKIELTRLQKLENRVYSICEKLNSKVDEEAIGDFKKLVDELKKSDSKN